MAESIRIECIDGSSPHLKAVMDLGTQHADTLGFFPKGAFQEHASRKHIFAALTSQNECLGYLLYRTSGNKATIVHLCANSAVRKRGVARKLVEHLKVETKHLLGIGLYCRRDYSVNDMWPRFGFVAVSSKLGRGHTPFQSLVKTLQQLFPTDGSPSAESDLRQIAHTIAADIQVFVTRDGTLRSYGDKLYEKFGLTILFPTELINQLDSIKREAEYQPVRLAGSRMKEMLFKSEHEDLVIEAFQQATLGERKTDFQRQLHRYLSHPNESECKLIVDESERPVVFIVRNRSATHATEIPLLRAARHPLAPTVVRHLLQQTLEESARANRNCTKISDVNAGAVIVDAMQEIGFVPTGPTWIKINLACVETAKNITSRLLELANAAPELNDGVTLIAKALVDLQKNPSPALATQIERALWPAKIIDADLPSFIVPIRPEWAEHFFDEELASSRLFGLRHDLHFGREAVYYRAKQISGLKFPGRILWYVSQGNEKTGSMSVKACSCLDEIVIGKPKDLYKQFRRLGIYEWRNVWELADKNLEKEIMAIRFSDTERFHTPVSLQELERLGVAGPIQSPRPITKEVFAKIYSMGYSLDCY